MIGGMDLERTAVLPIVQEWAAIRCKARCEKVVAGYLGSRGVSSYLPLITRRRVYGARVRESRLPLFPGYLFYDAQGIARERVFESRKVAQVLRAPDPDRLRSDLDNLAQALASDDRCRCVDFTAPGQPVRVVAGPLIGTSGELVRLGSRSTLVIKVPFLGLAAELNIDEACVRPA